MRPKLIAATECASLTHALRLALRANYSWTDLFTTYPQYSEATLRRFMREHLPDEYRTWAGERRVKRDLDNLPAELCAEIYRLYMLGWPKHMIGASLDVSKRVIDRAISNERKTRGLLP